MQILIQKFFPILFLELGALCSKVPALTGWKFDHAKGEPIVLKTSEGERQVTGAIAGVGRIVDLYQHKNGSIDVSFAHGKFAAWTAAGIIHHKWLDAPNSAAPILSAPNEKIALDFAKNSFSIVLLPFEKDGQWVMPKLKVGALVRYKLLTTDADGREGVSLKIEAVKFQ